jgi:hypothetical protein
LIPIPPGASKRVVLGIIVFHLWLVKKFLLVKMDKIHFEGLHSNYSKLYALLIKSIVES